MGGGRKPSCCGSRMWKRKETKIYDCPECGKTILLKQTVKHDRSFKQKVLNTRPQNCPLNYRLKHERPVKCPCYFLSSCEVKNL